MRTKDGVTLSDSDIRNLYPNISFASSTYEELGWIEQGIPQPEPVLSIRDYTAAVQFHLDTTVAQRNYDSILSAVSYKDSTNSTFKAEGLACYAWRDAVWTKCYEILADYQAGNRTKPIISELLAELPEITW